MTGRSAGVRLHPPQITFLGGRDLTRRRRRPEDIDHPELIGLADRRHEERPKRRVADPEPGLLTDLADAGPERVFAGLDLPPDRVP